MGDRQKKWWPFFSVLTVVLVGLFFLFTKTGEKVIITDNEISYRLKWLANTGFIGDLYAANYGYFTENGLKVTVKPGGPEHDAIRELQTGAAQFGVASADQVIKALAQGAEVKVVAQIYRKNPVQWIFRSKDEGNIKPKGLVGKSVGITIGDNDETIMKALLKKNSINEKKINLVPVRYDYMPFLRGTVDLFPVYKNTQGVDIRFQLMEANEKVNFFDPDKYGIHFVANSIVTTPRMLKENPDTVRAFINAALKGWKNSLDDNNRELSYRVMATHLKASSNEDEKAFKTKILKQIEITTQLVVSQTEKLGSIDVRAWEQTEKIMLQFGIIDKPVNITNHLAIDIANEK